MSRKPAFFSVFYFSVALGLLQDSSIPSSPPPLLGYDPAENQ